MPGFAHPHRAQAPGRRRERLYLRLGLVVRAPRRGTPRLLGPVTRRGSELRPVPDRGDPGAARRPHRRRDRDLAPDLPGPGCPAPARAVARRPARNRGGPRGRGLRGDVRGPAAHHAGAFRHAEARQHRGRTRGRRRPDRRRQCGAPGPLRRAGPFAGRAHGGPGRRGTGAPPRSLPVPRHHRLPRDRAGGRRLRRLRPPPRHHRSHESGAPRRGGRLELLVLALGNLQQRRQQDHVHRRVGRRRRAQVPRGRPHGVGRQRRLHHRGRRDGLPELLQDARAADQAGELRRAQRVADSGAGTRHHGAGLVPGRHLAGRLDRPAEPGRDRVPRPRAVQPGAHGERGELVGLLVQRRDRQLRDQARARHLRADAQRHPHPERDRRGQLGGAPPAQLTGAARLRVAGDVRAGPRLPGPAGAVAGDAGGGDRGRAAGSGRCGGGHGNGSRGRPACSRREAPGVDERRNRSGRGEASEAGGRGLAAGHLTPTDTPTRQAKAPCRTGRCGTGHASCQPAVVRNHPNPTDTPTR